MFVNFAETFALCGYFCKEQGTKVEADQKRGVEQILHTLNTNDYLRVKISKIIFEKDTQQKIFNFCVKKIQLTKVLVF